MLTLHTAALNPTQGRWPEHMQRALDLAARVISASPNPRVGCVIVAGNGGESDEVVGEGWHRGAGLPHAEPDALANAGALAAGATVFVTLEPCCHTGRTGPCSSALIAAGVAQVVVASLDPNPKVSGGGIKELEAAGVVVVFLTDFSPMARRLNRGFFSRLERGRPFVRCKLAMSLDGRTALANGASQWITGDAARADVQLLRAQSDAILTGIGTVQADDPALTVREESLSLSAAERERFARAFAEQPLRVVLDSRRTLRSTARVVSEPGRCLAFHVDRSSRSASGDLDQPDELDSPERRGVAGESDAPAARVSLVSVLNSLAATEECNEVLVEAGATVSTAFFEAGLIDEFVVYIAPKLLGRDAMPLLALEGLTSMADVAEMTIESLTQIGADIKVVLVSSQAGDGTPPNE